MSNLTDQTSDVIVVDIADPNEPHSPALEAARSVARDGSLVYLYHRAFHAGIGEAVFDPRDDLLDQARNLLLEARREKLTELGTAFPNAEVIAHTCWTPNRWQPLLAFAQRKQATMVVVQSSRPNRWRSLLHTNDDWQLIRHCKSPLLIARSSAHRPYRQIVAAVDPLHASDKPAELDHRIVNHAGEMARAHRARLSILNVVEPIGSLASPAAIPAYHGDCLTPERIAAHEAQVCRLSTSLDLGNVSTAVVPGLPSEEIVRFAADLEADLVVMGAVSRSALRHLLVGHTAEKVLNRLGADTMIVKPSVTRKEPKHYVPQRQVKQPGTKTRRLAR